MVTCERRSPRSSRSPPSPGQDAELAERAERLSNLEDLRTAAAGAREIVSAEESDEPDAVTLLDAARRLVERAGAHDAALAEIADSLANASYLVADVAAHLSTYLAGLDEDGARELEVVQERRAQLATLVRNTGRRCRRCSTCSTPAAHD